MDVLHVHAPVGGVLARDVEKASRRVQPRDVVAAVGQPVRDPAVATRHVEDAVAGRERERLLDERRLAVRALRRQVVLVEVEVLLGVEHLLRVEGDVVANRYPGRNPP